MNTAEKIYKKLLQVPYGKITTYGELSRSIGLKNGQRIVGQIMKKNPFPVIIPCHRVVKSNGDLGGFATDINVKIKRLQEEGVMVSNNKIVDFKSTLFKG